MDLVLLLDPVECEGSSIPDRSALVHTVCELAEVMVTISAKLSRPFSPDVPGDELGDQLALSRCNTGDSLLQSVSNTSNIDSPEGPGTGVCHPEKRKIKF